MNIVELKEEDLLNFKILSNSSHESIVYFNNNIVYKIFRRDGDNYENKAKYTKEILENKRKKLLLLNDISLDNRFIKANSLIYINDEFRGYTMDFISYITLNDCINKRKKEKLRLLKEAREIIKEAHKNGIILGDINLKNFILGNILKIGDLDNCCIDEFKTDSLNYSIIDRYLLFKKFDENLDWYLFNIISIAMITNRYECFVLDSFNLRDTIVFKNKELLDFYINLINFKINDYSEDVINILEKKKKIFII